MLFPCFPCHGHESHRVASFAGNFTFFVSAHNDQVLDLVLLSYGNDNATAWRELINDRLRNIFGSTGDNDSVERSFFLPAFIPISYADLYLVIP